MQRLILCFIVACSTISAQSPLDDAMLATIKALLFPQSTPPVMNGADRYEAFDTAMQLAATKVAQQMMEDNNDKVFARSGSQGSFLTEIEYLLKAESKSKDEAVQHFLNSHPRDRKKLTPYEVTTLLCLMFIADLQASEFPAFPTWIVVSKTERVHKALSIFFDSKEVTEFEASANSTGEKIHALRDRIISFYRKSSTPEGRAEWGDQAEAQKLEFGNLDTVTNGQGCSLQIELYFGSEGKKICASSPKEEQMRLTTAALVTGYARVSMLLSRKVSEALARDAPKAR